MSRFPAFARIVGAALCGTAATAGAAQAACPSPEPAAVSAIAQAIAHARSSAHLDGLRPLAPITRPAGWNSMRMATAGHLRHDDLRWAGGNPAAQNVGAATTPREAVSAMLGSAPHRRNLLDSRFRALGVGAVRTCDGRLMVTVNLLG